MNKDKFTIMKNPIIKIIKNIFKFKLQLNKKFDTKSLNKLKVAKN